MGSAQLLLVLRPRWWTCGPPPAALKFLLTFPTVGPPQPQRSQQCRAHRWQQRTMLPPAGSFPGGRRLRGPRRVVPAAPGAERLSCARGRSPQPPVRCSLQRSDVSTGAFLQSPFSLSSSLLQSRRSTRCVLDLWGVTPALGGGGSKGPPDTHQRIGMGRDSEPSQSGAWMKPPATLAGDCHRGATFSAPGEGWAHTAKTHRSSPESVPSPGRVPGRSPKDAPRLSGEGTLGFGRTDGLRLPP